MSSDQIWGVVRAILAAAGGYFVAKGTISSDTLNSVIGALGTIFAAGWSVVSKKQS